MQVSNSDKLTEDIFKEFKSRHIDPTVLDNEGRNALHYACKRNIDWLIRKLIANFEFDLNQEDHDNNRPLSFLI